jgi:hypothetical protein
VLCSPQTTTQVAPFSGREPIASNPSCRSTLSRPLYDQSLQRDLGADDNGRDEGHLLTSLAEAFVVRLGYRLPETEDLDRRRRRYEAFE